MEGVLKGYMEGDLEGDLEKRLVGGLQRGLQTGYGRGLAVMLRLGTVQVRSGPVYSPNLILLSLTLK